MEYLKYCCFELTNRAGIPNVVDHHTIEYLPKVNSNKHCVDVLDHPNVFHVSMAEREKDGKLWIEPDTDKEGRVIVLGKFFIGWDNLPTWQYFPERNEFVPIDPTKLEGLKRFYRREHLIKEDLEFKIKIETELKHLRKAVKALSSLVKGAVNDSDVQNFLSLSDYIESIVNRHDKSQLDSLDLMREEGITPSNMKLQNKLGIDTIPSRKELAELDQVPINRSQADKEKRKSWMEWNKKILETDAQLRKEHRGGHK